MGNTIVAARSATQLASPSLKLNRRASSCITSGQLQSWQFVKMSGEPIAVNSSYGSIAEVREAIARMQEQYPACSVQLIRADGVVIEDAGPIPDNGAQITVIVKVETNFSGRWHTPGNTQWNIIIDDSSNCLSAEQIIEQGQEYNRSGLSVSASWRTTNPLKTVGDTVDGLMREGDSIQRLLQSRACRITAESADTIVIEEYYYSKDGPSVFETINLLRKQTRKTAFHRATAPHA